MLYQTINDTHPYIFVVFFLLGMLGEEKMSYEKTRLSIFDALRVTWKDLRFLFGVKYHVSAYATTEGDGSEATPFKTIQKALQQAEARGAGHLTINLGRGHYSENLVITRNTTLIGEAKFNTTVTGCITCHDRNLIIKSITIQNAPNYGIHQTGGTLTLEKVRITNTQRDPTDESTERAIVVSDGAQATFTDVKLDANQGQALFLTGNETKVKAQQLNVRENHFHPRAFERRSEIGLAHLGSIEVTDHAKLLLHKYYISQNYFFSVLIRDQGQAYLVDGAVIHTRSFNNHGGINLAAIRFGILQAFHFISETADMCGLYFNDGYLNLSQGLVLRNTIGCCALSSPPDWPIDNLGSCIRDSVQFIDNQVNLDSPTLPIPHIDIDPDTGTLDTSVPPCPKEVTWD